MLKSINKSGPSFPRQQLEVAKKIVHMEQNWRFNTLKTIKAKKVIMQWLTFIQYAWFTQDQLICCLDTPENYQDLSKTLPFLVFPLIAERAGKIGRKLNASLKQCESKMKLKYQRGSAKDCPIFVCAHRFSRSFLIWWENKSVLKSLRIF